jgi:hypothetical protein
VAIAAVVVAFVLTVGAVTVSFALRRQVWAPGKRGNQIAEQFDASMADPQTFQAAVATSQAARRARLVRRERIRKILTPIAFGLSGVVVVLAFVAYLFAGDREAALVCTMMAVVSFSFATLAYVYAKRASHDATQPPP